MRTVVRVWDERPSVMFVVWSIYPGQNGLLGIHNNTTPFSMFLLSYFIHIIVVISNVQKEMPGMNFVVDYPSSLFLLWWTLPTFGLFSYRRRGFIVVEGNEDGEEVLISRVTLAFLVVTPSLFLCLILFLSSWRLFSYFSGVFLFFLGLDL